MQPCASKDGRPWDSWSWDSWSWDSRSWTTSPLRFGSAVALAHLVVALGQVPADAFWRREAACGNRSAAAYGFSSDPEWDLATTSGSSFVTEVDLAFSAWINGSQIGSITGGPLYSEGGEGFTARWEAFASEGVYARVVCGAFGIRNIEFNRAILFKYQTGAIDLRGVAMHEFGHVWGLSHTGVDDSHDGAAPTMATCDLSVVGTTAARSLEQDDIAAAQFRRDVVDTTGAATANQSFEHGTEYWTREPSWAQFNIRTDGAAAGTRYARILGSVGQDVTIVEGWNTAFRTSVRHRSVEGLAYFYLVSFVTHDVDYADVPADVCGFPDDDGGRPQDMNDRTLMPRGSGPPVETCYPTTSWATCTSDFEGNIGAVFGPDGVIIRSRYNNPDGIRTLDIDLARLQVRPLR